MGHSQIRGGQKKRHPVCRFQGLPQPCIGADRKDTPLPLDAWTCTPIFFYRSHGSYPPDARDDPSTLFIGEVRGLRHLVQQVILVFERRPMAGLFTTDFWEGEELQTNKLFFGRSPHYNAPYFGQRRHYFSFLRLRSAQPNCPAPDNLCHQLSSSRRFVPALTPISQVQAKSVQP